MKQVMLEGGEMMYFPDNAHDQQIDAAVQAYLGVTAQQQGDQMAGVMQGMQDIAQQIGQLAQSVQELASQDTVTPVLHQVQEMGQRIAGEQAQGTERVIQAVTSPREVHLPDGRKFTSVVKTGGANA